MPSIPGAYLVTLANPAAYTDRQLDLACAVAHGLNRGRLVLCEMPRR